jgi:hypothetical protein
MTKTIDRRGFLKLLIAGAVGGVSSGCATKAPYRIITPEDMKRPQPLVYLPDRFKWIKDCKTIYPVDAQLHDSPITVIHVLDRHDAYGSMMEVADFIKQASTKGISHIGLEGLDGLITREIAIELDKKYDDFAKGELEFLEKYKDILDEMMKSLQSFMHILADNSKFPEESAPGRWYAHLLKDTKGLVLCGIDDPRLYASAGILANRQLKLDLIKRYECTLESELEDYGKCYIGFFVNTRGPAGPRPNDLAESVAKNKDKVREFVNIMKQYIHNEDELMKKLSVQREYKVINKLRGTKAAEKFLNNMKQEKVNEGILIFGSAHTPEIVECFDKNKISYIQVSAKSNEEPSY